MHCMNLLHVGTTNYNKETGKVFLKTNTTAQWIKKNQQTLTECLRQRCKI